MNKNYFSHEQINVESLEIMSEDELSDVYETLDEMLRGQQKNLLSNPQEVEVDICYVQREIQLRRIRTKRHAEYCLNNPWVGNSTESSN